MIPTEVLKKAEEQLSHFPNTELTAPTGIYRRQASQGRCRRRSHQRQNDMFFSDLSREWRDSGTTSAALRRLHVPWDPKIKRTRLS